MEVYNEQFCTLRPFWCFSEISEKIPEIKDLSLVSRSTIYQFWGLNTKIISLSFDSPYL